MEKKIKSIVLIDDNTVFLESQVGYLQAMKFEVNAFTDKDQAAEAIAFIKNNKPDLVFVDQEMSGISGADFGKKVMNIDEFRYVPMVMLTAYSNINYAVEAFSRSGFDDFITKNDFSANIEESINYLESNHKIQSKLELRDDVHKRYDESKQEFEKISKEFYFNADKDDVSKEKTYQKRLNRLFIMNRIIELEMFPLCKNDILGISIDYIESNHISLDKIDSKVSDMIMKDYQLILDIQNNKIEFKKIDADTVKRIDVSYFIKEKNKDLIGKIRSRHSGFFKLNDKDKVTEKALLTKRMILEYKNGLMPLITYAKRRITVTKSKSNKYSFDNSFRTFVDSIVYDMILQEELPY
ncbi:MULTISPECIES: response regulator [unclassified Chryseobacterium]|uniref:response regulator n=1 Tax=unclassified Chryseobacterium TaxID=2593645 RepID=UPI000D34CD7E|nr:MULTISPECIES: response regulator [unclassified Chryseobacterium]PTT72596.1 hypothetical protein DBR25_14335 [Chryseobacterium sp. HMWF001]PVV50417.1 response regulator [Chryseobacterium sp. HMWF035]